ncbi:hypothetical protein [Hyalangium gracile]|uniref:hypothetical protein n=1 Tax=Hyalangium gracile TaxID=394092 RepID=UPI001CD0201E|nr:hypothetical protein [Hyalangium gracile]
MRRLFCVALCTLSLIACDGETTPDGGGGDGGTPPPDGGTQNLPQDITITGTTYYLGGSTIEQRPRAFGGSDGTIPNALVPNGSGGFTSERGELVAEGQVKYTNIPSSARPVWLLIDGAWRPVTGSSADFSLANLARMGLQGSSGTDTLTLNYTQLQPWTPGSQWFELHIPSHNRTLERPNSLATGFTAGATSGSSSIATNQLISTQLDVSLGDRIHVLQLESTSASTPSLQDSSQRVISGATISDLSLPSPGGAQRNLDMSSAPKRSVSLSVDAPAFETAAEQPSTSTRSLQVQYLVEAHQPAPAGAYETWHAEPPLVEKRMLTRYKDLGAAPTTAFTWDTSYADVLPANARRFVQAIYTTASPTGRSLQVHTHRLVQASGSWTLTPVVSAPRAIRVQGTEQGGVTTVSGPARLSWSPPATGTASSYKVEVWYVDGSNYLLGRFFTTSTELVVPVELRAGNTHYAVITAMGQSGDSFGSASAQSGSFRGP